MEQSRTKDIFQKHIGVVMGGCSSEKGISIKSGTAVLKALIENGCRAFAVELETEDRDEVIAVLKKAKIDIAFITLHGKFGEDGRIQEILESIRLPYTGSGSTASHIAMDKLATYEVLAAHHIRIPHFLRLERSSKDAIEKIKTTFQRKPVVIKPPCEGSSFGITIVHDYQHLSKALSDAFSYDEQIIVESYIKGKELTAGILGNKLLPVVEIRPKNIFFDYESKYQAGTGYIVPAEINSSTAQQVQQIAWKVHQAIGCRDLSRVDFILDENNIPWVLEINTIPGMTATSLLPKAAAAIGIDFKKLCLMLAESAHT